MSDVIDVITSSLDFLGRAFSCIPLYSRRLSVVAIWSVNSFFHSPLLLSDSLKLKHLPWLTVNLRNYDRNGYCQMGYLLDNIAWTFLACVFVLQPALPWECRHGDTLVQPGYPGYWWKGSPWQAVHSSQRSQKKLGGNSHTCLRCWLALAWRHLN